MQKYNIKQKNFNIEAFKIGRIFTKDKISIYSFNKKNYKEEIYIACIMGKSNFSRQSWSDQPRELSWFQAKGILEEFFEKLEAKIAWKQYNDANTLIIDKKLDNLNNAHLFYIIQLQKRT